MSPDVAQQFSEGIRDPYRLMVMRIAKGLAGMVFLSEPAIAKRFGLACPTRDAFLPECEIRGAAPA
jgi:hypothetical protein